MTCEGQSPLCATARFSRRSRHRFDLRQLSRLGSDGAASAVPAQLQQSLSDADRAQVRQLIRRLRLKSRLTAEDCEDLEQDALLHLYLQSAKYDTLKGPRSSFVGTLTDRFLSKKLRARRARKRSARGQSADSPTDPESPVDCAAHVELALDVRDSLSRLPYQLRIVAERLGETSKAEIARELGLSASTIGDRTAQIAEQFEAWGLSGYLGKN